MEEVAIGLSCRPSLQSINVFQIQGLHHSVAAFKDRLCPSGFTGLSHFKGSFKRSRQMHPFIPEKQRLQQLDLSWLNLSQDSLCFGDEPFFFKAVMVPSRLPIFE